METTGRPRKIWIILIAVVLGGIALGTGLSIGSMVVTYFLPNDQADSSEQQSVGVTTVRVNPLVVPIDAADPSFVDIIPLIKDAVVSISVTNTVPGTNTPRAEPGAGSGFIFAEDDEFVFIATNNHVVEGAFAITVSLDDNENVPARIVGGDRMADLAVISVRKTELEEKGVPFSIAPFGDSDAMRMGDVVVAIGNAMGEGQTVTKGIISALNLNIEVSDPARRTRLRLDVLQTDAAVNRGNSGGPLVNRHGEVIGIVTAKLLGDDIEGMGYALPSNNVYTTLMWIKNNDTVNQPFIGITHQALDELQAARFNLPYSGFLITAVRPDTPAEEAGLQPWDFLVSFDGRRVATFDELRAALLNRRPGDDVVLGIIRNGEHIYVPLTLGTSP